MCLKVWDGSSWTGIAGLKYWNGSSWVNVSALYIWDGVQWVQKWSVAQEYTFSDTNTSPGTELKITVAVQTADVDGFYARVSSTSTLDSGHSTSITDYDISSLLSDGAQHTIMVKAWTYDSVVGHGDCDLHLELYVDNVLQTSSVNDSPNISGNKQINYLDLSVVIYSSSVTFGSPNHYSNGKICELEIIDEPRF